MMWNRLAVLAVVTMLGLAACGGDKAVVEEGAGADAAGVGVTGLGQESLGGDLLSETRVYFEFDSASLTSEGSQVVEAHARHLLANSNVMVTLEGHCDERGTREYNLALGERRAKAVARMMRVLGVADERIKVTSYGEEKPLESGHDESAWRQNRRVEIIY
ncbi:MAG: peptidoglycan-associated lipoprotein Pal [Gammaproteobacteria bacterium]|nr:peptidoglycan-associated lipoprotein Pal [Gammaproteobacteria bacterium]